MIDHRPEHFPALEPPPPPATKEPRRRFRLRPFRLLFWTVFLVLGAQPFWRFATADPAWAFEAEAQATLLDQEDRPYLTWPEYGDRRPVTFPELPEDMVHAALAREDQRFFQHPGIDPFGIARAAQADWRSRSLQQGGSTITMQLVERVYGYPEKTSLQKLQAKVFEMLMAPRLEIHAALANRSWRVGKEAVLAAYLSRVEYGHQTVGLREAAHFYFGKKPEQLSLGECAYLAGVIRGPSVNNAYRNQENARQARDAVVANMEKLGFISSMRADQVSFLVADQPFRKERQGDGFLSAAVRRELDDLAARGEIPTDYLGAGRLQVHLAIDPELQSTAESVLKAQLRAIERQRGFPGKKGELQGAVVAIDNATGTILASVGGRDFDQLSYDCAQQARRPVASAAKPFLYASFLEHSGLDVNDRISNAPLRKEESRDLAGNLTPRETPALREGEHPLWKGLAHSSNRMTLRIGAATPGEDWAKLLRETGLSDTPPPRHTASWLGAFSVRPVDLAAAYAVFPRGGHYTPPHFVQRVEIDGRTVYRRHSESRKVLASHTADAVTRALREVIRSGTASAHGGAELAKRIPVAGKTGTSDGVGDAWFVGYGSEITLAVWIGFADRVRTVAEDNTGGSLAFPVWRQIMEEAAQRYPFEALPDLGDGEILTGTWPAASGMDWPTRR